jgi:DNA-binding CsgD family transcriptional regulator
VRGHPDVLLDSATPNTELAARQRRAFSALYSSEVSRARRVPDAGEAWLRTADACSDAGLAWEEAYACLRAAEALLLRRRGSGIGTSAVIRRGLRLAAELDAQPVASRLVELSTLAHIRLDDIEVTAAEVTYPGLHGLTEREREILTYVVAGRTYAQIAADLVISEKTVSSHISSLLRKTGASNRLHLSMLAAAARSTDG